MTTVNRNPCLASPMTSSYLTLSKLERSKSRSLRFRSFVSYKRAVLGHILLLNINRKAYMGSPLVITFGLSDLEMSMLRSQSLNAYIS